MRNRIRKKVNLVQQCGGSIRSNLSELDLKIYDMLPICNYEVLCDFDNTTDGVGFYSEGMNEHDGGEFGEPDVELDFDDATANEGENEREFDTEILGDQETVDENGNDSDAVVDSIRTLTVDTPEDLQAYMEDSMIDEDDVMHSDMNGFSDQTAECDSSFQQFSSSKLRPLSIDRVQSIHHPRTIDITSSNDPTPFINRSQLTDTSHQLERPAKANSAKVCSTTVCNDSTRHLIKLKFQTQANVRIPEMQKERLVQLVQNNFLKAMGRFAGAHGTQIKAQLWHTIANELNTLGPPRSAEQWKTVIWLFLYICSILSTLKFSDIQHYKILS